MNIPVKQTPSPSLDIPVLDLEKFRKMEGEAMAHILTTAADVVAAEKRAWKRLGREDHMEIGAEKADPKP